MVMLGYFLLELSQFSVIFREVIQWKGWDSVFLHKKMIQQNKSLMENEKQTFSLGLFKVLHSVHCLKSLKGSFVPF